MGSVVISRPEPAFTDGRGEIYDLIEEEVHHIGMVTFTDGAVRGNHYHKRSIQHTYVLSGRIELRTRANDARASVETHVLRPGDLVTVPALTRHVFRALEASSMIDLTTLARGTAGYEEDTVRVEPF